MLYTIDYLPFIDSLADASLDSTADPPVDVRLVLDKDQVYGKTERGVYEPPSCTKEAAHILQLPDQVKVNNVQAVGRILRFPPHEAVAV